MIRERSGEQGHVFREEHAEKGNTMTTGKPASILRGGGKMKKILAIGATALLASVALSASSWAAVKDGRSIEVFHGIEYVGLVNYPAQHDVKVEVLRGAKDVVIGSVNVKTDDDGFAEINHVGGGPWANYGETDCWDEPATPDIRPGDVIRTSLAANPNDVDTAAVRDIFIDQDKTQVVGNTIEMYGHVRSLPNAPIDPAADILELRLNAGGFTWQANNNRRDLREDVVAQDFADDLDGDPTTFKHIFEVTPADAANWGSRGGEQAFEWSAVPATGELTVFDGEEGALPGCPALAETAMTSFSHSVINKATIDGGESMTIGGPAQAGVTGVDVKVGGQAYPQVAPESGTWQVTVPTADLAALPQGAVPIEATFVGDTAPTGTQTKTVQKDTLAPTLSATPASGATATGSMSVTLASDGGEQIRYTRDGSLPDVNNSQVYNGAPINLSVGTHTIRAFSEDGAKNRADATFTYTVQAPPPPPPPTGGPINGTNGPDVLRGTPGNDVIYGRGGNDIIYGLGGNDTIRGGAGNDTIVGGTGVDKLYGDAGNDRLNGRDGKPRDLLNGGSGRDTASSDRGDVRRALP
jgi:Ca2+-binding RTX toxin-like protein